MATHQKKAFITYGALIDFLCPVGKDLILAYDLGDDYATKLQAMFPGTTWSGKTTVNIKDNIQQNGFMEYFTENSQSDGAVMLADSSSTKSALMWTGTAGGLSYAKGLILTGTKNIYLYRRSA